jgi:hypothetical protein
MPRDGSMYQSNGFFRNVILDNTKEERQEEQDRKNEERKKRGMLRTQNGYRRQFFS